jgi:hypothetical protein
VTSRGSGAATLQPYDRIVDKRESAGDLWPAHSHQHNDRGNDGVPDNGTLLLDAQDSMGMTANRIDTVVPTVAVLAAGVSTVGDIFLNQTAGALRVGTAIGLDGRAGGNLNGIVTSANNNDITLVSAGAVTATQNVTAHGGGNVALKTTGANDV